MKLYFAGAEIPSHRTLLEAQGVDHVSLSYMGLRRRTKFSRPWVIKEKFPESQHIFLDSGAYTVNKAADDERYSIGELKDIAAHYMSFVYDNVDRLEMVSEFDAQVLGQEWILAMRDDFWDDLPESKFLPVWHADTGLDELDRLARTYSRVGITQTDIGGRNLAPILNGLTSKYGTKLHGIAMTRTDEMASIRWDSVASTSWLSPSQYGDTIVWTGKELKRYPKKYKDRARKQHRTLFTSNGFDAEKIAEDDTTEVLKLSIWSWQKQAEDLNRHRHVVSTTAETSEPENTELTGDEVVTSPVEGRNQVSTLVRRDDDERINLPVLGILNQKESYVDEDGERQEREVPLLVTRSESLQVCDTCFLASKCPGYKPSHTCMYNIPMQIRTKDQLKALSDAMIEIQAQRILFMRMAEQIEGGYADPNLSSEIDRMGRLLKVKTDMESESFSFKVEAKSQGQAGVLSRLFGREAGERALGNTQPMDARQAIESYIDAEIVDER
jgi:hypothetical protein